MIQKKKNKLKLIAKPQDQATKDSILVNKYNDQEIQSTKPGNYKQKNGKTVWVPDRTKAPYKKEKGGKVCPKCGKVHAAGMGCAKSKMYRQGGGLNRISFMQQGKNLPTAPKAEDRYKNGRKTWNMPQYKEVSSASNIYGDPFASRISMEVNNNGDTTFYETPGRWLPVKFKTRQATKKNMNFKPLNPYSGAKKEKYVLISPEYETLKRRFNTAWNLAK